MTRRSYAGENNPAWKPKVKKICPTCKNVFEVRPSDAKKRKYCSLQCYRSIINGENNPHYGKRHTPEAKQIISNAAKARLYKPEVHPNYKPKVKKICPVCGNEFVDSPAHAESRLCCSKKCKGKWQSIAQIGENNPCWRGGHSAEPYCILFNDEFKERVRCYYGYICVECGAIQNGRKHCVHHVNYDKETCCNDGVPLFVCLCNECNLRANGSKKGYSREWWQEHFTNWIYNYYGGKCYLSKEEMKAYTEIIV
jgi:hypothetical protein